MRRHAFRYVIEMARDHFGTPIVEPIPGATVAARLEMGRSMCGPPESFPSVRILANRQGLTWLAHACLALANARNEAEELMFHVHVVDPTHDGGPAVQVDLVRDSGG